jgi:hypothetical protein
MSMGKRSSWKLEGGTRMSAKRRAEKEERENEPREAAKRRRQARAQRLKEAAGEAKRKQRDAETSLRKHQEHCHKHHVDVGPIPKVPYAEATARQQRERRSQLEKVVQTAASKLLFRGLTPKEMGLAATFWKEIYQSVDKEAEEEERQEEEEPKSQVDAEHVWRDKWTTLFRLRGVADSEGAVSTSVLRRIFMACELTSVTGGKLHRLEKASHYLQEDQPEAIARAIGRVLSKSG